MSPAETSDLLALIARYDNRKADDATVLAWYPLMADLDPDDARQAVINHFANEDAYLMPVHIRRGVTEIRRNRRRIAREAAEAEHRAIEAAEQTRRDRSGEVRELIAQLRTQLPEGDPDSLRYGSRYWREVREARERQERAEPNPHYDPEVAAKLAAEGDVLPFQRKAAT